MKELAQYREMLLSWTFIPELIDRPDLDNARLDKLFGSVSPRRSFRHHQRGAERGLPFSQRLQSCSSSSIRKIRANSKSS